LAIDFNDSEKERLCKSVKCMTTTFEHHHEYASFRCVELAKQYFWQHFVSYELQTKIEAPDVLEERCRQSGHVIQVASGPSRSERTIYTPTTEPDVLNPPLLFVEREDYEEALLQPERQVHAFLSIDLEQPLSRYGLLNAVMGFELWNKRHEHYLRKFGVLVFSKIRGQSYRPVVLAVKFKLAMVDLMKDDIPTLQLSRLLFKHTASVLLVVSMFDANANLWGHGLLCNLASGMQLKVYEAKDGYAGRMLNYFWRDKEFTSSVAQLNFHAPLELEAVELYEGVKLADEGPGITPALF
jgi:hypothetical protein